MRQLVTWHRLLVSQEGCGPGLRSLSPCYATQAASRGMVLPTLITGLPSQLTQSGNLFTDICPPRWRQTLSNRQQILTITHLDDKGPGSPSGDLNSSPRTQNFLSTEGLSPSLSGGRETLDFGQYMSDNSLPCGVMEKSCMITEMPLVAHIPLLTSLRCPGWPPKQSAC